MLIANRGVIAPARGDEAGEAVGLTEPLLPPEVATLGNVSGIQDYTVEGVEEAMARYPDCVRDLASRAARIIQMQEARPQRGKCCRSESPMGMGDQG